MRGRSRRSGPFDGEKVERKKKREKKREKRDKMPLLLLLLLPPPSLLPCGPPRSFARALPLFPGSAPSRGGPRASRTSW